MRTSPSATHCAFWVGLLLSCCSFPLRAELFGLFTYEVINGSAVMITGYPTNATTPVGIPAAIAGKPVTSIGDRAFFYCTGLTSVTIPSSVTHIHQYAFSGCTGLTSLTIPSSVTFISEEAFSHCTGLSSLNISEGVTQFGEYAFSGCSGLTSVTIPSSVTSIAKNASTNCTGLTTVTIPEGVARIGVGAFFGCTGLTNVTIPASVINIEPGAFSGCIALEAIAVAPENPQYVSVGGVLLNSIETTLICFPGGQSGSYNIPSSVTAISDAAFSDAAFSGCSRLTKVIIPSTVTSIGSGAFFDCSGLTSLTLPQGLTTIANNLFRGCSGLTTFTIPSGVTAVGYYAFFDCTGLTSVTIPLSVTQIEYSAFSYCTNLTRAIFLGDAPHMEAGAFSNTAPEFTSYYLSSRSGFTSPTWFGYPATVLNETTYPAAVWLLGHGLWYDTDLHTDSDGDGVDLFMAYALDLDPRQNLQASLPVPVLSGNTLSLNFHATAPGVIYRAETSTGLTNWTTAGVTQSAPGPDGRSTATIPLDAPRRFLRLSVED